MLTNSNRRSTARDEIPATRPVQAGRTATPSDISARGWWNVLRETVLQVFGRRLLGEAAAVEFHSLLIMLARYPGRTISADYLPRGGGPQNAQRASVALASPTGVVSGKMSARVDDFSSRKLSIARQAPRDPRRRTAADDRHAT